jgi:hypothetical protein
MINKQDILTYPVLPEVADAKTGDSMKSLAILTGGFTLAADKFFKFIELKNESSNVTSETQGETGGQTLLNKATLILSGTDEQNTAFARQALNDDILYIYQEQTGKFRVLGNENFMTKTKPAQASGTAVTDASTTTLEVEVPDVCPSPFYTGDILISATVKIDASTGKEVAVGA